MSKAIITFGTGMIVARGLGPEQYGMMMFLLGTFTAVRQLLDMGSSTAFFTLLSQRQRSLRLVSWYFLWLGIQFLLPLIAVGVLFPDSWIELIWKSGQRSLVVLAFVAAFMQSMLWLIIQQMGESQRLTHWVQSTAVVVALAHLLLMAIAWWSGWLAVKTVFSLTIIEWVIAVVVIVRKLQFKSMAEEHDTPVSIMAEFWNYCWPLVPYACLSFAYEFADRWLLQNYAGSTQQAYFAVAFQFGSVTAIATSSILNIFWKEIAEAHHQGNRERVGVLYQKVSRGLFFIAAVGAGFLAPWAKDILFLTLGAPYAAGSITLMIMFFYPLHQALGQIGGAMAYATGRVRLYVKNGMVMMGLSVMVTYFTLADSAAPLPGLGLGSLGLAGKMLAIQIVSVNVLAFCLSRSLGIQFDWQFQPLVVLVSVTAGLVAYAIPLTLLDLKSQIWFALPISGAIFALLMMALVGLSPNLVGLNREDVTALFSFAKRLVHS